MNNNTTFEGSISAEKIKPSMIVYEYTPDKPCLLTGYYVKLTNCIPPSKNPTILGLTIDDNMRAEQVSIPVFPYPLNQYTRTNGKCYPPLDVGQSYHTAFKSPIKISPDQSIKIVVIKTESMQSGITGGLNFASQIRFSSSYHPFRESRESGPITNILWSKPEVIATGNQIKGDPFCAPQNNSGISKDLDGTLFNFTAFYSVDEQYDGGRMNSYSRIYGFRKIPDNKIWENMGLIVDPLPNLTYAGDPFTFRDLDDTPCLVYTTANGTQGFIDWNLIDARIICSKTKSFKGPWGKPHAIFEGLPGHKHDDRANCIRIYPRVKTNDYVIVWQHGERDIVTKGLIIPSLSSTISHEEIMNAPILIRNQEEGGGGFISGEKGYLNTWQIPSINDPTTPQRLYEFDLYSPLDPESWRVVAGSWGRNYHSIPLADGGITADSMSMSYFPTTNELYTTFIAYSKTLHKNTLFICHTKWGDCRGDNFEMGTVNHPNHEQACPVVEYAIGEKCAISLDIQAKSSESIISLILAPSNSRLHWGGIGIEISKKGYVLIFISKKGKRHLLFKKKESTILKNKWFSLQLSRNYQEFTATINGKLLGKYIMKRRSQRKLLKLPQRFKIYGKSGDFIIKNIVLSNWV